MKNKWSSTPTTSTSPFFPSCTQTTTHTHTVSRNELLGGFFTLDGINSNTSHYFAGLRMEEREEYPQF